MSTASNSTSAFQLSLNRTTGMFSMSSTEGPLLSSDLKITVPAGTEDAYIQFLVPDGFSIVEVRVTIVTGADSPAIIILEPPEPPNTFQPRNLFKFNVGNTDIVLSAEGLDNSSVTFKNSNGSGGAHEVRFGVWFTLQDTQEGCIYQTRDPQIDDVNEGGG